MCTVSLPSRSGACQLQAGVPLAFSSDWPVVPIDPLLGMFVAVHRRSPAMLLSQAWHIDGAVTPQQAMLAHTQGAAFACGLEQEVGSLRYTTRLSAFGVFQVIVESVMCP